MQNFQQQYSRKVITGSFDDLQHIVYAQISIKIFVAKSSKYQRINMKSIKQASIAH